jgi:hypothetical protein
MSKRAELRHRRSSGVAMASGPRSEATHLGE